MLARNQLHVWIIRICIVMSWIAIICGTLYLLNYRAQEETGDDLPVKGRVLRLLIWGDIFDKLYLQNFEREMGVTVQISSYDSNEELIVKLKGAQGRGYDLISPSDYAVKILREEGLLKPLDKQRMPFYKDINPLLLGQHYDPENRFSIPYEWEIYGLAYDKEFFRMRDLTRDLGALFHDPQGAFRVVVSSDPLEMVRLAAHYLYGPVEELTTQQIQEVQNLLQNQHKWVEAYTRTNLDYYLISGYSPLAFASSAYVGRRKEFVSQIGFFVPEDGAILTIENLAMPLHAENEDLVYAFLEFVMSRESMSYHFDLVTYFPSILNVDEPEILDPAIRALRHISPEQFKKLFFIKRIMPEEALNHLWVAVKS